MIWSKTVIVWSRVDIFVDSGQNPRLQYFRSWAEKRDIDIYFPVCMRNLDTPPTFNA